MFFAVQASGRHGAAGRMTMDLSRTIAALAVGASLSGGCGFADDTEFQTAVPTTKQTTIPVPGPDGKTSAMSYLPVGVGVEESALVGSQSEYYSITWGISAQINFSAAELLGLLHLIVTLPPTTRTANGRTWGPYTPGGLDPLTYRTEVTRTAPGAYTYSIDARLKSQTKETDFVPLLDGVFTRGTAAGTGKGSMTLHFDNRRTLRADACEVGTVVGLFDDTAQPATLDVTFKQFANDNPNNILCKKDMPADAQYHFDQTLDGAGNFQFKLIANANKPEQNKPLFETSTIRSRWRADGTGRSDVRIEGGEVATDLAALNLGQSYVSAAQCWDSAFLTTWETSTPSQLNLITTAGDATKCAFAELPPQ